MPTNDAVQRLLEPDPQAGLRAWWDRVQREAYDAGLLTLNGLRPLTEEERESGAYPLAQLYRDVNGVRQRRERGEWVDVEPSEPVPMSVPGGGRPS